MNIYRTGVEVNRPGYLSGGSWILEDLNEITVLFGKNGIGKSALLRGLRSQNPQSFHYTSPERAAEISHDVNIAQEELGTARGNRRSANFAGTFRQEAVSRIQAMQLKMGYAAGKKKPMIVDL